MERPDFEKVAKVKGGYLPRIDDLTTNTALLRRIAHNTEIVRLVLVWTAVIIPLIMLGIGITVIVLSLPAQPSTSF